MSNTQLIGLRKYELLVIMSGDMTETDFGKETDEIRKLLKESSAVILYEESWGKKEMTYKIKRQKAGYYVVFDFEADPTAILEMRNTVKLNPHVLRHLLISVPNNYVSGSYKKEVVFQDENKEEEAMRKPVASMSAERSYRPAAPVSMEKPIVAGKKEEEQLKIVEKKLEEILDNPDINIK